MTHAVALTLGKAARDLAPASVVCHGGSPGLEEGERSSARQQNTHRPPSPSEVRRGSVAP